MARRARGLGMIVTAYDPYASEEKARAQGVRLVSFDEALQIGDFFSLHMPLTPGACGVVNCGGQAIPDRCEESHSSSRESREGLYCQAYLPYMVASLLWPAARRLRCTRFRSRLPPRHPVAGVGCSSHTSQLPASDTG